MPSPRLQEICKVDFLNRGRIRCVGQGDRNGAVGFGLRFTEGGTVVAAVESLAGVFSQVTDPRKARGVRHPFRSILSLVFLGLLARIREMAVVVRWATAHWDELKEPLGFTRDKPPCDTTISRALAKLSLDEFRQPVLAVAGDDAGRSPRLGGQPPLTEKRAAKGSTPTDRPCKCSMFFCNGPR